MNDSVLINLLEQASAPLSVGTATQSSISVAVERARDALLAKQHADGHWVFELEADATIPAEYVLMTHYLGETPDRALEAKIARYLLRIQGEEGGWSLFHDGEFDISASVKAYFALKMTGEDPDSSHMRRARAIGSLAIRSRP